MTKQVTFASSISSTISISQNKSKQNWYSLHDKGHFLQAALREARRLRGILDSSCGTREKLTEEDLYECVGVEKYLSRELLHQVEARKREHIDAVIVSQARFRNNVKSKKEMMMMLSRVSKNSSQWARMRARELAVTNFNCPYSKSKDECNAQE